MAKTIDERFFEKVIPEPNSGCWLWDGACFVTGYGKFKKGGIDGYAHRFSYELHFGQIKNGLHVLHTCDNPSCVNPEHLFLGTQADNNWDSMKKGRRARGERLGKLTEDDVRYIRRSTESGGKLAVRFGICRSNVGAIRRSESWAHIQTLGGSHF
jgi:hypothetical protein